ncbi:MAG: hypothetical protein R3D84_09700 [Paracoccaceae bacterium]
MSEILATLTPTAPRRIVGTSVLAALGALLLSVASLRTPAALWLAILLYAMGAMALFLAVRLWQVTARRLELTAGELREAGGARLAHVAEIRSVSRGAFAFKPSNGFGLRLSAPGARAWRPGLWWRIGTRVGVGGVTSGPEARFMAETIDRLIAGRAETEKGA